MLGVCDVLRACKIVDGSLRNPRFRMAFLPCAIAGGSRCALFLTYRQPAVWTYAIAGGSTCIECFNVRCVTCFVPARLRMDRYATRVSGWFSDPARLQVGQGVPFS
jgi:hypothetical protein